MASDSEYDVEIAFALKVYECYTDLVSSTSAELYFAREPDLGGKLFYAGELDEEGRALLVASNIAGSTSLCASSDTNLPKQAIRDGVVDFLVTSLDEALRILKNEIRKHETVAVCVSMPPDRLECEMLERGVMPDLLRPSEDSAAHDLAHRRHLARQSGQGPMAGTTLVVWDVAASPARWLPKLDEIAQGCLSPNAGPARRWLRLAPRYLGRMAKGIRLLVLDREFAARFVEQVRVRVEDGEIQAPVEIRTTFEGGSEEHHFSPAKSAGTNPG